MHFFPTVLAIFVCSSINSESQRRPLAVIIDTTYKHSQRREQDTPNAPMESVTNKKAPTAATKLKTASSARQHLEQELLESRTDLKRCKSVILTGSKELMGSHRPSSVWSVQTCQHAPDQSTVAGAGAYPSGPTGRFRPQAFHTQTHLPEAFAFCPRAVLVTYCTAP